MIIPASIPLHLTYCLNIHPGETWEEQFGAIRGKALAVRSRVAPDRPFGLGLRLSGRSVGELGTPPAIQTFRTFLDKHGLYVFTVNGSPYGSFRGTRVKEKVYQPDWRTTVRRDYTTRLADVLQALLPEGGRGSIGTVPCSFKPWVLRDGDVERMVQHLSQTALHLHTIAGRHGREIHLGLEPEPGCYLETAEECVTFFNQEVLPRGSEFLRRRAGHSRTEAEALLRRHVGICFDTCHLAIQFEDLVASLARFKQEGIRVSKIQLSAALQVANEHRALETLRAFVEPVYLHQVKAPTRQGALHSWTDLPDALRDIRGQREYDLLRVHFHVPLSWEGTPFLASTATCLTSAFFAALQGGAAEHLEIETDTFDVLPDPEAVEENIAREYRWVLNRLAPIPGFPA